MHSIAHERIHKILPPGRRLLIGLLISAILAVVIAGAICIPFYFESSSILYKFGHERQLLRSGQVVGIVAGCLLMLQIILGARLKCLDRVLGLGNLFIFHRITGSVIACLAIMHPILVFIPEGRVSIPLQLRYWPEFIGLLLLLIIVAMVISSQWRAWLKLAFHRWWPVHRAAALVVIIAFWIHILSVSSTFEQQLPRIFAFCAIGICGLLLVWIRSRPVRNKRQVFEVAAIEPAGDDAVCLQLVSTTDRMPVYIPGQFSFISPLSAHVSSEEHPFTIASSPERPSKLEFIVRTSGDWTGKLKNLRPKDRVLIDGPFGLFSHLRLQEKTEIIMIAGGIGITPMLSMLRHMADCGDQRKITLIWSNQTRKHIIHPDEFQLLEAQLKGLRIFHFLTRDPDYSDDKGRLDWIKLKRLLSDCSNSSAIFLCGPDQMMKDIYSALVSLGFSRRQIFRERFIL